MKKSFILIIVTYLFAVDYQTEIQPIFDNNCGGCHLGNSSSGGLSLTSYENLMSSGTVVPGDHQSSNLYDRIVRPESAQGDMPPAGSLLQNEIDLIAAWIDEGALPEEPTTVAGCMDPNAITCDDDIDPLYFPECETCSDDVPCENYYNSEATEENGLCMYNDVPSVEEFIIVSDANGFDLDWSSFTPPVSVNQYVLERCVDIDGDGEYENCVLVLTPFPQSSQTSFFDEYLLAEGGAIKYTLSVGYPNNNYWGSAFGEYYFIEEELLIGDLNFDGIVNVIDIVTMVNGILGGGFTNEQQSVADFNNDGIINVIDIVSLVNLILS